MTRTEFRNITPGTPVNVYAFGVHAGVVVCADPVVTIQGRTFKAEGWLKIRIAGKPEFNGTFKDVDIVNRLGR